MKKIIIYIIEVSVMMLILVGFKYLMGYENTIFFIFATILIELWSLDEKK